MTIHMKNYVKIANLSHDSTPFERYTRALRQWDLAVRTVLGDGNCLFRAASLQLYGSEDWHEAVRMTCVDLMELHAARFAPFVEGGRDAFPAYLRAMRRPGCWGDDPELQVSRGSTNSASTCLCL